MCQPIYFLPNLRQAAADSVPLRRSVLKERGLADVFADVPYVEQPLFELPGRGPGNLAGCLLTYQTPTGSMPRRWGYYPDEQSWTPVGDGSLLWIGLDTAEPPKAEELARKKLCRGYPIDLNGQEWIVPVIRRHDPAKASYLPSAFVRSPAGGMAEVVRAAYRPAWDAFADVAAWYYGGMPEGRFETVQLVEKALEALALNYRIGWNEQDVLQIVDSENFLMILAAAVDFPGYQEANGAQKKMSGQPVTPNTTPGAADSCPTTNPPGAICS